MFSDLLIGAILLGPLHILALIINLWLARCTFNIKEPLFAHLSWAGVLVGSTEVKPMVS